MNADSSFWLNKAKAEEGEEEGEEEEKEIIRIEWRISHVIHIGLDLTDRKIQLTQLISWCSNPPKVIAELHDGVTNPQCLGSTSDTLGPPIAQPHLRTPTPFTWTCYTVLFLKSVVYQDLLGAFYSPLSLWYGLIEVTHLRHNFRARTKQQLLLKWHVGSYR